MLQIWYAILGLFRAAAFNGRQVCTKRKFVLANAYLFGYHDEDIDGVQNQPRNPNKRSLAVISPIKTLYKRLNAIGFNRQFVQEYILPDWWDDTLSDVPSNLAIAELAIARHLGFRIDALHDPKVNLSLPPVGNFRLKRNKNVEVSEVHPSIVIASRAAELVASIAEQLPVPNLAQDAKAIRREILAKNKSVDLAGLVRECWSRGVVVLHIAKLPKGAKKFDGVAMFWRDRPVIVLASARKGPPWLAFHLAHEMGHLCSGHVKPGDPPLVDADISFVDNDEQEQEANKFGCAVLTGPLTCQISGGEKLKGDILAEWAKKIGEQHGVDPGTVVLCSARETSNWGAAQLALKCLDRDEGAHAVIAAEFKKRLGGIELIDSTERFLGILSTSS